MNDKLKLTLIGFGVILGLIILGFIAVYIFYGIQNYLYIECINKDVSIDKCNEILEWKW